MPRRIDYVGRFEFIRQAAFAVVRDDGPDALSRRRVAAELGTGVNTIRRSVADWVDLVRLAADQVVSRRRLGRLSRRTDDPVEAAGYLVRSIMPEDSSHLDEELVWWKLLAACAFEPSGLETSGQLKREFGIAQCGYDAGVPAQQETTAGIRTQEDRRSALRSYVADRDQALITVAGHVLALLEVPKPWDDAIPRLIAMVEGLTLAACLGRLTPERATALAIGYAMGLHPSEADIPPVVEQAAPPGD